jgi:hypothetical protein
MLIQRLAGVCLMMIVSAQAQQAETTIKSGAELVMFLVRDGLNGRMGTVTAPLRVE